MLNRVLAHAPPALHYVDYMEGDGETVFQHACAMGIEGIVSKRMDTPYRGGRREEWLKRKCFKTGDFPIIAFVEKLGAKPRRIASLYLGRREDGRLLYAGKAQTGFRMDDMYAIRERLDPFITRRSPLDEPTKKPKATWVEPVVLAEVEYSGVTEDGLLREPVFRRMREDLMEPPAKPAPGRRSSAPRVPRENLLQLLPDAVAPSEEELAQYWGRVWRKALKYLGRRPLKLVRHVHGTTFYHKGPLPEIPPEVHRLKIEKREGGEGTRLWVDSLDGFLGLVAIGAIELHPWNATVDDIEHPDVIVFDLDPGEGIEWEFVRDTAFAMRDLLKREGHTSWLKLTGGKGIHLMSPIAPSLTHDEAHAYARELARRVAATAPDRYTLNAAIGRRKRRLFIDYLRNGRGTTAVGACSPRARPGFPAAMPVTWRDVERGTKNGAFSMLNASGARGRNSQP
jgi:bifunctional non-homologous end joining protein LigD